LNSFELVPERDQDGCLQTAGACKSPLKAVPSTFDATPPLPRPRLLLDGFQRGHAGCRRRRRRLRSAAHALVVNGSGCPHASNTAVYPYPLRQAPGWWSRGVRKPFRRLFSAPGSWGSTPVLGAAHYWLRLGGSVWLVLRDAWPSTQEKTGVCWRFSGLCSGGCRGGGASLESVPETPFREGSLSSEPLAEAQVLLRGGLACT
jgi:hypothetical protein